MAGQQEEEQVGVLVRAARMYYEQNLSQEEIALELRKSRATISRMLRSARERGIVHTEIRVPIDRFPALERALSERFGLREVRVVAAPSGERNSFDHLGRAAAKYLQSILKDGMCVGISNGRALAATAKYLEPERSLHLTVVQIIGSMGAVDPAIDGPDIARALATAYDAQCRYLHVPLLAEDPNIRNAFVRDRNISQTLKMGAKADVVLIGVGTLDPSDRSPVFADLLTQKDIAIVKQHHGIGHICGEYYSVTGERLDIELNDRAISIGLGALRKIPHVIAVAGGPTKAAAILGGIRGGYLNTLITDDRAAIRILEAG
jgi:DNA-binding transcriptional regulator LsrR (DeoR family)